MLPDVFASNVVFLISAVYIGGLPVADHVIRKPGNIRITGADACRIIFGGADDKHKKQNKIRIRVQVCMSDSTHPNLNSTSERTEKG